MLRGYENYGKYSTYNLWTYKHLVRDFKDVYNVAIDVGSLTATVEGAPLPELATADIGASGKVGVYGGTVSLSFQSMINDDMGAFMRIVGNAGYNANRSIDELLYTTLEAATITGTNNLVASVPLGTAGNLDTVRAGFMAKTGPSGKKLGNVPRKLIVPPNIAKSAAEATWNVVAPGSTALFSAPENRDIDTVISPYLTSTSTYYLAGDPSVNPAFDLLFLQGFETPIIQEYDVGSVLGRAWKIALPFGVLFNSTTVAGSIYIPGLVKATA
jgi:hypothetical protein